jgi:uncharacterized flavoprotein (TIGR03862 family)
MSDVVIVGGGPSGLSAAEQLSAQGFKVTIYDRMPSVGRKFLLAGRGGLNLTHSEPLPSFLERYGHDRLKLSPFIEARDSDSVQQWSRDLGEETFVGSSGRVFPRSFKASPLLRAWLRRLADQGVVVKTGHRWMGWADTGALMFETAGGPVSVSPKATLLALGGASWPRLGSDGSWVSIFESNGIGISALHPANCGFAIAWSPLLKERFAGTPLKRIALSIAGKTIRGEAMITDEGIEGGAVYALSGLIREQVIASGSAALSLDLRPDLSLEQIIAKLDEERGPKSEQRSKRGNDSFSNVLRKRLALSPVAIALLREVERNLTTLRAPRLAALIKTLPLEITGFRPIDRAISTAGGVRWDELDDRLMIKKRRSVFCCGEMLDWDAPTGGYLLQGCFATGHGAALGIQHYLQETKTA